MTSSPRAASNGRTVTALTSARPSGEGRTHQDVLTFHVADEEYGINIEYIREITKSKAITEVPRVPTFVAGIILVRGQVVPVIDLRQRLRLSTEASGSKARILVVSRPAGESEISSEDEREQFGLIIDRVNHVIRISDLDLEPPSILAGHESEFVSGLCRIRIEDDAPSQRSGPGLAVMERFRIVILLDLTRLLTFEHAGSARSA
jgi:chemotaxis signal transduction protein